MTEHIRQWRKMTWALIIFTALMAAWVIAGIAGNECRGGDACEAGTAVGVGLIIGLWFMGFVALSLIWFMTRPRS